MPGTFFLSLHSILFYFSGLTVTVICNPFVSNRSDVKLVMPSIKNTTIFEAKEFELAKYIL